MPEKITSCQGYPRFLKNGKSMNKGLQEATLKKRSETHGRSHYGKERENPGPQKLTTECVIVNEFFYGERQKSKRDKDKTVENLQ